MSLNRHSSSRRKLKKSNNQRRKSSQLHANYETLEERRLLAVDIGISVQGSVFGRGIGAPNQTGGVGPAHVVEVVDSQFQVFDKTTGQQVLSKSLDAFWLDQGPGGASAAPQMVAGTSNARVLYDADTRRWFISSVSSADVITGADGTQSPTLVAVSRTSDPTLDWTSLGNRYDVDANPLTPSIPYDGGFLSAGAGAITTALSVDDHNLYVTVGEASPFVPPQTWAFHKFEDLVVPNPTSANASAAFVSSSQLQWGTDVAGEVVGSFGLWAPAAGSEIFLTELTDPEIPGGATFQADVAIPVDPYETPPRDIRQEFDPDIINLGSGFLSASKRLDNSLWAAHTIRGSAIGQNPDGGIIFTSAIRWYEIDLDTQTVKQSGTIESEFFNYIMPSIAVTPEGHIAVSYTSAGVGAEVGEGLFPTLTVSVGYSNNGIIVMEDPVNLKDGEGGYYDGAGNFWGGYGDTVADPNDPDKVWVFGQWSDDSDNGITQVVELNLVGHSPELIGTVDDNVFVVRRSALDPTQIEVELDGIVIETYQEIHLYGITIEGGGGDDTFVIDTVNGELNFPNGVTFVGDGDDQVIMDTVERTNFEIFVDGSGQASVGTNQFAVCEDHSDVNQQFILNFEAGSGWEDATPYGLNGYATRGDALQGELQKYFDEQIAPIFSNSFSMELDINDDETDSLASARALGIGLEDVSGQDLMVGSPWSILVGRGDRNADASDGEIDFNLDVSLYQDNFEALLQNIAGGLTRSQFFNILGMDSEIPNETNTFDPRGTRNFATVMDVGYRDLNDNPLVGNYNATDSMFDVLAYQANANWAGDNTGIYFMGTDDTGNPMPLIVNSNAELIDFDTLASSLAGTSRAGSFHDIIEQDRAFLRGMGFSLNPVIPVEQLPGQPVRFSGIDEIQAGDGEDFFCIRSSNVDLQINGGIGNDTFNVTGLGVGAINLFGEAGDDTYQVVFSPAGVITIGDSIGSENDTLIGLGTSSVDTFVFDVNGIKVNAGLLVYVGIENTSFDGLGGDDVFEIKAVYPGIAGLNGGDGMDTFIVNESGAGDTLTISVDDPAADPVDRLRLDIGTVITDSYTADQIENFQVDGTFVIDGVNGTPTVAGGMNLLGDGNEVLFVESSLDANWLITSDGAGNVAMDTPDPINFTGLELIHASWGVDSFVIQNTDTDLAILGRTGDDSFQVNNVGMGVLTINGNEGEDSFEVLNSGSTGVNLFGDEDADTFTFNDAGTGVSVLNGNLGADVFTVLNSGTTGLTIDGDEDNDIFNIDNPAGTAPVMVFGSEGDDVFNVINSGFGQLDLMGEAGDDTYSVTFVAAATVFNISDSINAENDRLIATGTDGNDVFDLGSQSAALNGGAAWSIVGIESFSYDGLLGDDIFNVDTDPSFGGTLDLHGGEGNDSFVINNSGMGVVTLNGDLGDDSYTVYFQPNTNVTIVDSVGSEADSFFGIGTDGADLLTLNVGVADVNGGMVSMTGIESVDYDGRGGNDTFEIADAIGDSTFRGGDGEDIFNIAQTTDGNQFLGDAGNDVFNIATTSGDADFYGNAGDDVFNITSTTGNGSYYGGDGNDIFNVFDATGVSALFGEAGMDQFNITDHLAKNSVGSIDIDGGADRNQIIVNGYQTVGNFAVVSSSQIRGMSAVPINYSAAGSFSVANGFGGIQLIGSDTFNDSFDINTLMAKHTVDVKSGGGNDRITVSQGALGAVSGDGQEGSDIYQYAIGSQNNRFLFALDTGIVGSDRIVATLTEGDDVLNLSGESFAVQTDSFGFNMNFESLVVNARGGNDTIDINRLSVGFMRILAGAGDDQINVNNFTGVDSVLIDAGSGNDNVMVNAGTVAGALTAVGGDGDDSFLISQRSYGNAVIDGQEGSDRYDVFIADRSTRFVVARDSGIVGQDHLSVYGTVLDDDLTFRSGVVRTAHQDILYTQSTETMTLLTEGSRDTINVYGVSSPITTISGQAGNDLIVINSTFGPAASKVVNVDAGAGNDTILVRGTNADTQTNVFGRDGDDNITMGSTLGANNGNLNNLMGVVFASGGSGHDRLYFNDVGKTASFNYEVGPTSVRNNGSPSNFFGGVNYDGSVEVLRLDATNFRNEVLATPSMDTAFSFFGNNGFNSIALTGDPAIDGRQFFGQNGGVGFWNFSDGSKDVFFSDFLLG